ncbi:MAG: hypothetical protein ABR910_02015 [Acidobacteriaceae bacterium]|jgi:hypothetical protein
MKVQIRRWLLGLAMLLVFAGVYTPPEAQAKVVVVIGAHHRHHRHYYHRRYRH